MCWESIRNALFSNRVASGHQSIRLAPDLSGPGAVTTGEPPESATHIPCTTSTRPGSHKYVLPLSPCQWLPPLPSNCPHYNTFERPFGWRSFKRILMCYNEIKLRLFGKISVSYFPNIHNDQSHQLPMMIKTCLAAFFFFPRVGPVIFTILALPAWRGLRVPVSLIQPLISGSAWTVSDLTQKRRI